jgi:hypothetical protein
MPESASSGLLPERPSLAPLPPVAADARIPKDKRERFNEVATLLEQFGQTHLDPELTGFTLELWRRLCRRQTLDCRRGNPHIWGLPQSSTSSPG